MTPTDYVYTPLLIIIVFVSSMVCALSIIRLVRENRNLDSFIVEVSLTNVPQGESEEMTTDEFWEMIEGLHDDQDDDQRETKEGRDHLD